MEEYHGPAKPVGLIIMAGVAYYIPDKKRMVKQVMDWLIPGGQFIMTHIPPSTPLTKGQEQIRKLTRSPTFCKFKHPLDLPMRKSFRTADSTVLGDVCGMI